MMVLPWVVAAAVTGGLLVLTWRGVKQRFPPPASAAPPSAPRALAAVAGDPEVPSSGTYRPRRAADEPASEPSADPAVAADAALGTVSPRRSEAEGGTWPAVDERFSAWTTELSSSRRFWRRR